ncbi:hypothetical protein SPRG_13773 [Saprolegnia parasitica CBS 223.65]|uniref:Uncharacterized protein n=1 Tax=Saprolegnia parasitica (strain CBS 223.65) TaxID=695850 RepID=A0A067C1F6_SAPPC|nr:hypothetical protein SPRG_13773 [Saprolegnia parasitica CBS 223.65]KDO20391.1 hypothetical protein SPRG_13773 [Saprolegnia parasitica CBS 223.65]|eukprot:XP_012208917.1 hypothetical protein SPRG_13773 [Saprolegnia parasitica CBS 223.65]
MDAATIDRLKAFVKKRRQRRISLEEKLDILYMHAVLRESQTQDTAGVIARQLGRSTRTVKEVLSEFLAIGDLTVAEPPSNKTHHASRVPRTPAVRALVRTFIRDRCVTRTRTVAKDVLALLEDKGYITGNSNNTKDYTNRLRVVQKLLAKEGYLRGKRRGETTCSH